jgi:hypothetical protein
MHLAGRKSVLSGSCLQSHAARRVVVTSTLKEMLLGGDRPSVSHLEMLRHPLWPTTAAPACWQAVS